MKKYISRVRETKLDIIYRSFALPIIGECFVFLNKSREDWTSLFIDLFFFCNLRGRYHAQLNGDVNYFQRKFVNEVRRCDEMERKLRYIEAEVKKDGVAISDDMTELPRAPNPREVIDLEVRKINSIVS